MVKKKTVKSSGGLEEFLEATQTASGKKAHLGRTYWEAYTEIKKNLLPTQKAVEKGAMAEEIRIILEQYKKQIDLIMDEKGTDAPKEIQELLAADPVLFLNDHGPDHIEKVIERANQLIQNFTDDTINEFEAFVLLCAIQIHDIGNILGRSGHEKKLIEIFDKNAISIIPDSPERRLIKMIAMAHGGKENNGDTISRLSAREAMCDSQVRTRLLAAILRFADELADDSTRASRVGMDMDIIGASSEIYHDYSLALYSVRVEKDDKNSDYIISLRYELEVTKLEKQYNVGGHKKYLLDEIYDRTLKMERERRYCMKFMYPCINLGRISVEICVYNQKCQLIDKINYKLEDISYPNSLQLYCIKDIVDVSIRSGEEELAFIRERGENYD